MIASIDSDWDIDIFLEQEEVDILQNKEVTGVLIWRSHPKHQGIISLLVDDKKANRRYKGIEVEQKSDICEVFIENEWYLMLKENGRFGTRYDTLGSKFCVYNKLKVDSSLRDFASHLEFYRDNRDKLRAELG